MTKDKAYIIVGMVFGGGFSFFFLFVLFWNWFKPQKKISLAQQLNNVVNNSIINDLKIWSKHNHFLHIGDVLYKYHNTQFFQSHSIIVTDKCLIVVLIKNVHGDVSGDAKSNHLTFKSSSKMITFSNPIQQNDYTIKHLQEMIGIKVPTISLVIFSDKTAKTQINNLPNHVILSTHKSLFAVLNEAKVALKDFATISKEEMKTLYNNIKIHETKKKPNANQQNFIQQTISLENIKTKINQ